MSEFKEAFTFLYFPLFPSKHPSPQNQSILLKPLLRKISLPQSPSTPSPSLVNIQTSELMSPFDYFFCIHLFCIDSFYFRDINRQAGFCKQNSLDSQTTRGVKSQEKGEKLLVVHPGPWKVFTFFKCGKE